MVCVQSDCSAGSSLERNRDFSDICIWICGENVSKQSCRNTVSLPNTTSRGQNSATHSISKNLYRFIACHFLNSMNSQSSHEMISTLYLFLINILINIFFKNQFTKRFVRKHDVNQCNHLQIHQIWTLQSSLTNDSQLSHLHQNTERKKIIWINVDVHRFDRLKTWQHMVAQCITSIYYTVFFL